MRIVGNSLFGTPSPFRYDYGKLKVPIFIDGRASFDHPAELHNKVCDAVVAVYDITGNQPGVCREEGNHVILDFGSDIFPVHIHSNGRVNTEAICVRGPDHNVRAAGHACCRVEDQFFRRLIDRNGIEQRSIAVKCNRIREPTAAIFRISKTGKK